MRKIVVMLGALLIAAVFIISGSAVAPWVYEYVPGGTCACTNPDYAESSPDYNYATIGQNPDTLGKILLDLGPNSANWMAEDVPFTVYGWDSSSGVNIVETYSIKIYNDGMTVNASLGSRDDDSPQGFTTPSFPEDPEWRYYEITATSGDVYFENEYDTIYGPEIDAVGW
ncbi:MAG: hypothetical protein JSW00_08525 [Thermoplasmata archaeon]|nr:MAG: hypothetical protein JSW00_08525 [Thermoplasmata archaeon]